MKEGWEDKVVLDLNEVDCELWLDWPPSINSYYSHTQYGVHIGSKGRAFRDCVIRSVHQQLGGGVVLPERSLKCTVVLFAPDKRKRDLDNHMKGLLDALQQCVLVDDALIDELRIVRGMVTRGGSCYVKISAGAGYDEDSEDRGISKEWIRFLDN